MCVISLFGVEGLAKLAIPWVFMYRSLCCVVGPEDLALLRVGRVVMRGAAVRCLRVDGLGHGVGGLVSFSGIAHCILVGAMS